MDLITITGYFLALWVGISLGLVGSGGSILTVPILVYVLGLDAITATGYSLFVVGSTALVGAVRNAMQHHVHFGMVVRFGVPSMITAYLVRAFLIPAVPDTLVTIGSFTLTKAVAMMVLFASVMWAAAVKMLRPISPEETKQRAVQKLIASGIATGLLAGAVGAGGGFLIIPALVFLAGLGMKKAVGTSLFIVAIQSLAGFLGGAPGKSTDWAFLLPFTAAAIVGIIIGTYASRKIDGAKLKKGFAYFILVMAAYILIQELGIR